MQGQIRVWWLSQFLSCVFYFRGCVFENLYSPPKGASLLSLWSVYGTFTSILLLSFFSAPFLTIISATFWTGLVSNAFSICAPLAKWQIQFRSVPHWHGDKFNFDLCPTALVSDPRLEPQLLWCQNQISIWAWTSLGPGTPQHVSLVTRTHIHRTHRCTCTHPRTQTTHTGTHAHTHNHTHTHTHTHKHTHKLTHKLTHLVVRVS